MPELLVPATGFALAQPIPVGAIPEAPRDHGQHPVGFSQPLTVPTKHKPYYGTDDAWRSTLLPYQREYSLGRLGAPNADHLAPTGSGGYVAVAGAGIGRPQRLASVPVYHYGPDNTLVRSGREATGNPTQWQTTSALSNGLVYERANPVRWPTT